MDRGGSDALLDEMLRKRFCLLESTAAGVPKKKEFDEFGPRWQLSRWVFQ